MEWALVTIIHLNFARQTSIIISCAEHLIRYREIQQTIYLCLENLQYYGKKWEEDSRNFKKLKKKKKNARSHLCLYISEAKMPLQDKKKGKRWSKSHHMTKVILTSESILKRNYILVNLGLLLILHIKPCNFCFSY